MLVGAEKSGWQASPTLALGADSREDGKTLLADRTRALIQAPCRNFFLTIRTERQTRASPWLLETSLPSLPTVCRARSSWPTALPPGSPNHGRLRLIFSILR